MFHHKMAMGIAFISVPWAAAAADTYEVDPSHSTVIYQAVHFGTSNSWGRFNDVSGTLIVDEAGGHAATSVELTVKTASIDSWNQKRDDHLRGPDFFNAVQFPVMSFKSSDVAASDHGELLVTGTFTLHGVSKEITVPVQKIGETDNPWGHHIIGYEARFSVNRTDYGMNYMVPAVSDAVNLIISVEAKRQ